MSQIIAAIVDTTSAANTIRRRPIGMAVTAAAIVAAVTSAAIVATPCPFAVHAIFCGARGIARNRSTRQ